MENFFCYSELFGICIFVLVVNSYIKNYLHSPRAIILSRWLRWIFTCLGFSLLAKVYWLPLAPLPLIFFTNFTLWFIFESFMIWRQISRFSTLQIPIFPKFAEIESANLFFPNTLRQPLEESLAKLGFSMEKILRTDDPKMPPTICPVFRSENRKIRLLIKLQYILPQQIKTSTTIYSICEDGDVLLTENNPNIYGGYYPKTWHVIRRPLMQNIDKLIKYHQRRIEKKCLQKLESAPVDEINSFQDALKTENLRRNFIVSENEEKLFLSSNACYRIWLEVWLLTYLGRTI